MSSGGRVQSVAQLVTASSERLAAYTSSMSVVPHSEKPTHLVVLPPLEALRRAQPLPSDDELTIDGIGDGEWAAFEKALADR